MAIAASLALIVAAWILLFAGVEPVPTWFYVFVWYPTLVLLDQTAARVASQPPLLRDPRRVASLFAWSAVIWLLFEAANLRLRNWYYVFLPRDQVERWSGIMLSFATVVPALMLMARLLETVGVGRGWRTRPIPSRPWHFTAAVALGMLCAALALGWPGTFFPLIWGAAWLLSDPFVHRRRREWSLLGDIERGEWGRIGRLMLGGLLVGLLWEFYNYWALGKWIYTVPWLEEVKLFEMPPLGFMGFPVFALEAWALYHVLCSLGVAVPADTDVRAVGQADGRLGNRLTSRFIARRGVVTGAIVIAMTFSALVLLGMERRTISSVVPRLEDLPGIDTATVEALRDAGIESPFALARASVDNLSINGGPDAESLVHTARLATLRGLGARYTSALRGVGLTSVCELAATRDPVALRHRVLRRLVAAEGTTPGRPTDAEIRLWIRAATRECARRRS